MKKQKTIQFNAKKHTYTYDKKLLTSVTTFIHQFFEPFNAKDIARKLAKFPQNKKAKKGVRYFLKEWKESAEHGTRVHKLIEKYIVENYISTDFKEERDFDKFFQMQVWYDDWNDNNVTKVQEAEKIIFNEELGIAGTIDLYAETTEGVTLIDWKTNKKIDEKGFSGKKGLKPIEELEDCHLTKYTLQLSLYAYILDKYYKKKIHKLYIVHLMDNKFKEYEVPYEREIIERLLNYETE